MTDRPCPVCHRQKKRLKYIADEFRVVCCKSCGFVYSANPMQPEQAQQVYDNYFEGSQVIDPDSAGSPDQAALNVYTERLQAVQRIRSQGSLLEIGCGRGYFLNMAAQAGYQVSGIEISSVAAHYAGLHYNLDVQVGDFEEMDVAGGEYDIIVMWHVLEHFRDPAAVISAVNALLRKDGILILEVPNLNSLKFRFSPGQQKWQGGNHPRYHMSFFNYSQLKQLLTNAGFVMAGDLNLTYAKQNNLPKSFVKSLLNQIHVDSFLSVWCTKE